jgi:hypothetical protein
MTALPWAPPVLAADPAPSEHPALAPLPGRTPAPGPARHAARGPARGADARTSRVRPYALTGGRTRSGHVLLVETFVATIGRPDEQPYLAEGAGGRSERFMPELRAIVELCRGTRSVAEISALLRIPLGVVRVLISDLADQGRIRVYGTGHGPGSPDRALLERVLSGLRRL